jgi:hypothetical protein
MWRLSDERTDLSLQLLLALSSAVILESESRETHGHNLLSQFRDSPYLEGQVLIFISPRNRVAQFYHRRWVPFLSPPSIRRNAMEALEPASTLGTHGFRLQKFHRIRISQETHYMSATKPSRLMLLNEKSLFIVRTIRNTQIHCAGRMQYDLYIYIYKSSPYFTRNTLHLRYKAQPLNAA